MMNIVKTIRNTLVILAVLNLTACSTIFGNKDRHVTVNSVPPGAEVYLNGEAMGRAPVTVQVVNPLFSNTIAVKKDGYKPLYQPIMTSFQPIGLLNIFFWPGFIIDAVTGSMMKVETHNVTANLAR